MYAVQALAVPQIVLDNVSCIVEKKNRTESEVVLQSAFEKEKKHIALANLFTRIHERSFVSTETR